MSAHDCNCYVTCYLKVGVAILYLMGLTTSPYVEWLQVRLL
jgi:hypothetical protein